MTPPIESFPASELPPRVLGTVEGKRRKGWVQEKIGGLGKCELLELVQYKCEVEEPRTRESVVRCWPVERLFRRCRDQNGTFMVETTAWEGRGKEG